MPYLPSRISIHYLRIPDAEYIREEMIFPGIKIKKETLLINRCKILQHKKKERKKTYRCQRFSRSELHEIAWQVGCWHLLHLIWRPWNSTLFRCIPRKWRVLQLWISMNPMQVRNKDRTNFARRNNIRNDADIWSHLCQFETSNPQFYILQGSHKT